VALVHCRYTLMCLDIQYLLPRYQPEPSPQDAPVGKVLAVRLWWDHLIQPSPHPTPRTSAVVAWALTAIGMPGSDGRLYGGTHGGHHCCSMGWQVPAH